MKTYFNREEEIANLVTKLVEQKSLLNTLDSNLLDSSNKIRETVTDEIREFDELLEQEVSEVSNLIYYSNTIVGEDNCGLSKNHYIVVGLTESLVLIHVYSESYNEYSSESKEVYYDEISIVPIENYEKGLESINLLGLEVQENLESQRVRAKELDKLRKEEAVEEKRLLDEKVLTSVNKLDYNSSRLILFCRRLTKGLSKENPVYLDILKKTYPTLTEVKFLEESKTSLILEYTFINNKETGRKKNNRLIIFKDLKEGTLSLKAYTKSSYNTLNIQTKYWKGVLDSYFSKDPSTIKTTEQIRYDIKQRQLEVTRNLFKDLFQINL